MADCVGEVPEGDLVDWHFLETHRRTRAESFVNLMLGSEPDLPEIEEAPIVTFNFNDCELETAVELQDLLELPKRRPRTSRKRTPPVKKSPPAPMPIKQIGTIPPEERRRKIRRFLEKRQRRIWAKRISYDCRKRVADGRLRVKGRFVTKAQAVASLGIEGVQRLLRDA